MGQLFERAATSLLVAAALIVAGGSVYRILGAPRASLGNTAPAATQIPNWRQLESQGFRAHGSESSSVRLVIFADLECPGCAGLHAHLTKLTPQYGDRLSVTYLMFPLAYHKFARVAADATACVERHGESIGDWITAVYEKQDSIGLRPWRAYAVDARLSLGSELLGCLESPPPSVKVDSSLLTSEALGIDMTPTLLINGWKFASFKSAALLDSAIQSIERRK